MSPLSEAPRDVDDDLCAAPPSPSKRLHSALKPELSARQLVRRRILCRLPACACDFVTCKHPLEGVVLAMMPRGTAEPAAMLCGGLSTGAAQAPPTSPAHFALPPRLASPLSAGPRGSDSPEAFLFDYGLLDGGRRAPMPTSPALNPNLNPALSLGRMTHTFELTDVRRPAARVRKPCEQKPCDATIATKRRGFAAASGRMMKLG
jgi:hypothetical protein